MMDAGASDNAGSLNDFHVDLSKISSNEDPQDELMQLGIKAFNQQDFEEGVAAQVEKALSKKEEQRAHRLLSKELATVTNDLRLKEQSLNANRKQLYLALQVVGRESQRAELKQNVDKLSVEVKELKERKIWLQEKLAGPSSALPQALLEQPDGKGKSPSSFDLGQAALVECGELTPFEILAQKEAQQASIGAEKPMTAFEKYLEDQSKKTHSVKHKTKRKHSSERLHPHDASAKLEHSVAKKAKLGASNKKDGGNFFDGMSKSSLSHPEMKTSCGRGPPRRKLQHNFSEDAEMSDIEIGDEIDEEERYSGGGSADEWKPEILDDSRVKVKKVIKRREKLDPGSSDEDDLGALKSRYGVKKKTERMSDGSTGHRSRHLAADDGSHKAYLKRLANHEKEKALGQDSDSGSDMEFDGGFKVPGRIWNKLYRYQKTGVRWLWELHCQKAGGILGDEMGLGKTIQVISFLAGLDFSQLAASNEYRGLGPTLIVCPTTVLHQWVKEFHKWWPKRRVAILHHSGSYSGSEVNLIRSIVGCRGVLVTAYSSVLIHQDHLLPMPWHYVILDEGHKIRNPNAQITVACKQLRTCHRIILSGSPVQNNLKELWSLFDFIFPGKLGTLPDFMQHFSVPIVQGGYSNATQVAVQTAYKCACVLRDTINPYLLRRMKADVKNSLQLPAKNEQVLFCRLTPHQREVYKEYLDSKECGMILAGNFMVFPGLITLRKVCNHPDLSTGGPSLFNTYEEEDEEEEEKGAANQFGYWKRSGKMVVVDSLLRLWHKQGHRVLLFSQSRQMLDIMQKFVELRGYTFRRMDGATPIPSRQPLINSFNQDNSIFLFLLTTRVGGLGINLTGANRVVIFDPDWNPSTDMQARERAWRIGQLRDVTVYRLLTAGTIEEKIYHRQIFKQFLTNRVLKDPKQRRFFKSNDLYELFTLTDDDPSTRTETSAIFAGTGSDVKVSKSKVKSSKSHKNRFDLMKEEEVLSQTEVKEHKTIKKEEEEEGESSEDEKLTRMRELAKRLSQRMFASKRDEAKEEMLNGNDPGENKVQDDVGRASKERRTKSKKLKKHKRKCKDAKFEGERLRGLVRQSSFKPPSQSDEEGDGNRKDSEQQDDYVIRKLLKKNGVHSVLHHDRIMQSSRPDYALVEMEADRVAKEAARALKASRSLCLQSGGAAQGVPTWTGQVGSGGAPGSAKPRFGRKKTANLVHLDSNGALKPPSDPLPKADKGENPGKEESPTKHFDGSGLLGKTGITGSSFKATTGAMSSSELLSRMRQRNLDPKELMQQEDSDEDNLFAVDARSIVQADSKNLELLTELRNFLAVKSVTSGPPSTDELLTEFKDKVTPQQSAVFRSMLREIATLQNMDNNKVKVWKLKLAFR